VSVTWIAVGMAASIAPFAFAASTGSGFVLTGMALGFATLGLALKLGAPARLAFWLLCLVAASLFAVLPLIEGGPDPSLLGWCAVFPLALTLFDGARAGAIGLAVGVATALAMLAVADAAPPDAHPSSTLSIVRGVGLVVISFLFALVSERMRSAALARAQAAMRARTYFLASMSHEFRTPMNGVIGVAESMLERPRSVEDHEALQLIKRSGHQLLGLIGDTLDLASLDAGRVAIRPEPTSIAQLAHDAVELTGAAFRMEGITLRIEVAEHVPPWLELDPLRVRQVLTNLVGNALKFTQVGSVVLRVDTIGSELLLTVTDTGVGIAPAALERIFEPFERAHPDARVAGHGLGLAITRQLVELMQGTIGITSQVGRGTSISVRLPLRPAPAPLHQSAELPADRHERAVLVVDDNEVSLRVAAALVRRSGFQVVVARTGEEALKAVAERPFALVLMDCHMPQMDGFEATRRIRMLPGAAATTPVVAVTASAMPEEHEDCLAAGMNASTVKPLTLDALERVIARSLSA